MHTIIFSKNRACQLDLLLRSLNLPATVLYAHDEEFEAGYRKLIGKYPDILFIHEVNFKEQTINLLEDYTMFLCDDDIMMEPFDTNAKEFQKFQNNDQILCLSIRLSPFLNGAPEIISNMWRWKGNRHSWGYPMSVTSTIFRKDDILPIMIAKDFKNPIELEVELRDNPPNRPFMLCCDRAYVINNLANKLEPRRNNYRTAGQGVQQLNAIFLAGNQISLERILEKAAKADNCFMTEEYFFE